MRNNLRVRFGNLALYSSTCGTVALGLVLILTSICSAAADDVKFGFASSMGGTGDDAGTAVTVADSSGNVYTTGPSWARPTSIQVLYRTP